MRSRPQSTGKRRAPKGALFSPTGSKKTYRAKCVAPDHEFRRFLQDIATLALAAYTKMH